MPTKTAARTAKTSTSKSKKLPVCTKKDLRTPKRKRRKCTVPKKTASSVTVTRPSPSGAVAAPPATAPVTSAFPVAFPEAPGTGAPAAGSDQPAAAYPGLAVYDGPFGAEQAQRLLFRAGFGPKPGQADALAALGVRGAVDALVNPGVATLQGPAPSGAFLVGGELAPLDKWGHLHLEALDRMIRSTDSLTERMTLVLHDWFGVNETAVERNLCRDHIALLRANWQGSFRQLLQKVTLDPGMLIFLNGAGSDKSAPNENYARELMELFALGADRGAYTETDVKELARGFTGWTNDWSEELRAHNFRFVPSRFDGRSKTVFAGTSYARNGNLSAVDSVNAVVDHPMHSSFVVLKLWSYFIPTAPTAATQQALEGLYRSSGERLDKLVEAMLLHPDLYRGASMTKPPVVYAASLLRSRDLGITGEDWAWRPQIAGQIVGQPPSVAGWNDRAWMNTSSFSARWGMVTAILNTNAVNYAAYTGKTETPAEALASALAYWNNPTLSQGHLELLQRIAAKTWVKVANDPYGALSNFLANRQNILRQLIAAAPDAQVT